MRDVAALAGVSLSTVSRVVNGTPVAPELAVKVTRAVEMLGYRHNEAARNLRRASGLSASVGLIFEDISNPFFSAIHRGVEDVARTRSVLTLAGSSDEDAARERELAESLVGRRVDGLVIVPAAGSHSYLLRDVEAGMALVFVDRPPQFIDADFVVSDNAGGSAAAVTHLIEAGHSRIGFLGDQPEIFTAAERLRGYREALAMHGVPDDPVLVRHPAFRAVGVDTTVRELLAEPNPPTALFTAQNLITMGALRTIHELGLQDTVALVGFDDIPLADALSPGITVVAQDPYGLGRRAAELLFSRLDGYDGPARRVVLDTTLIERGSGEIRPG
ncbi:MAG: LacI family DNA-binding transcriptional regulator [Solirubrobacteraceae bacterium]